MRGGRFVATNILSLLLILSCCCSGSVASTRRLEGYLLIEARAGSYDISVFTEFDAAGEDRGQSLEIHCLVGCARNQHYSDPDLMYFSGIIHVPGTDRLYVTWATGAYLIIAVYGIVDGGPAKIFQHASKTDPLWTLDEDGNDVIIISEAEFIDRERFLRERRFKWSPGKAAYMRQK